MLNKTQIEALKAAALANDWSTAGEALIDLSLDANNTAEERQLIETIAPAVRLRDAFAVVALIDEIVGDV